jgi:hypothetical protein
MRWAVIEVGTRWAFRKPTQFRLSWTSLSRFWLQLVRERISLRYERPAILNRTSEGSSAHCRGRCHRPSTATEAGGVKSEVTGRSDFNRRWADLFFEASNTFMVAVERILALVFVLAQAKDPNNQAGTEMQGRVNDLFPVMIENRLRLQRLAALATTKGPEAYAAAERVYLEVAKSTQTRTYDLLVLRDRIDEFNRAARRAHAEVLALRNSA